MELELNWHSLAMVRASVLKTRFAVKTRSVYRGNTARPFRLAVPEGAAPTRKAAVKARPLCVYNQ